MNFRTYYYTLKLNERTKLRDMLISELNISKLVFYNWLSGRTKIPVLYQKAIAKLLNVPHSVLFPQSFSKNTKTKQISQNLNQII